MDFGTRVRQARRQAGLTLDELARRSRLSRSALSKIERGERNPSLLHALRIAEALGKTLSELLGESTLPRIRVTRAGTGQRLVDPRTGAVRESLLPPIQGMEVIRYTLPSGGDTGAFPPHPSGTIEVFLVEQGEIAVELEGQRIELGPGDAAAVAADVEHRLVNRGTAAAVFVLLIPPR